MDPINEALPAAVLQQGLERAQVVAPGFLEGAGYREGAAGATRGPSASRSLQGPSLTRVRAGAALAACLLLLACGGSGSGDERAAVDDRTSGATPPATPSPTTPPAVPASPPAVPVLPPAPAAPVAAPSPVAAVSINAELVTGGLRSPWSLAFLPDGSMLVTERPGSLRRITTAGQVSAALAGVPAVVADGQGGLLDVVLSPGFASDRTIFFAYSESAGNGESRTAVARARLDENSLSEVTVIFRQTSRPGSTDFGSRLVFGRDGALFVTLSERRDQAFAQDLTTTLGKVIRILPDGAIPADNPVFPQPGAVPGIWSYGHRNPQGAALNPVTGELWISEHGPRGGDEINRVMAGRNYGWPRITYGRDYDTGEPIGEGTAAANVEPPLHYWVPISVAPAGIAFYTGDRLPGWQGSLLVATLAGESLIRLALNGDLVIGETRHLASLGERIRDIRQGPDGFPYLLTDSGRLMRVVPQ